MIIYAYDGSVQNLATASIANEYLLVHSIYDYLIGSYSLIISFTSIFELNGALASIQNICLVTKLINMSFKALLMAVWSKCR
jgi:hypothetical protein